MRLKNLKVAPTGLLAHPHRLSSKSQRISAEKLVGNFGTVDSQMVVLHSDGSVKTEALRFFGGTLPKEKDTRRGRNKISELLMLRRINAPLIIIIHPNRLLSGHDKKADR